MCSTEGNSKKMIQCVQKSIRSIRNIHHSTPFHLGAKKSVIMIAAKNRYVFDGIFLHVLIRNRNYYNSCAVTISREAQLMLVYLNQYRYRRRLKYFFGISCTHYEVFAVKRSWQKVFCSNA